MRKTCLLCRRQFVGSENTCICPRCEKGVERRKKKLLKREPWIGTLTPGVQLWLSLAFSRDLYFRHMETSREYIESARKHLIEEVKRNEAKMVL